MLFSFAACGGERPDTYETTLIAVTDKIADTTVDEYSGITETSTVPESVTENKTTQSETTVSSDNPSEWSSDEIVEFYKSAAAKSQTVVKYEQVMTMESLVVNDGDGFVGKMIEFATPIMKTALKNNSKEFDGITGGYKNLTVSDTKSVRAYKSGEYIIVEMTMKEQTDGIHGDAKSGTVGHAISVVGDISVVADALPQFTIDFENADLKLRYSDANVKVKINKNGIIEKGTWSYTVNVTSNNLYIATKNLPFEVTINSSYGSVDYVATVGGGF